MLVLVDVFQVSLYDTKAFPTQMYITMENLEHFGDRVRTARKNEGLKQAELADKVGISRTYLSQIEQGRARNLSLRLAQKLSEKLGIELPQSAQEQNSEAVDIPPSLAEFAKEEGIPEEDQRMLARIQYRGKKPQDAQQWRVLYSVIQATTERDK